MDKEHKEIKRCAECRQLILKGNDKKILELISSRMKKSYEKYNAPIPIDDGRDWIIESIEEVIDGLVYLSNKIMEIKEKTNKNNK